MASCSRSPPFSTVLRGFWSRSNTNGLPLLFWHGYPKPSQVFHYSLSRRCSFTAVFSRRRKKSSDVAETKLFKSKKTPEYVDDMEGNEKDEDAFEALFSQLEEDLKTDETFSDDSDSEITEDDLARLEQELDEALCIEEPDEVLERFPSKSLGINFSEDEEESRPKLKSWQLRRLARALKIGRRKASIKNLSAELGLERAHVLELLREPPPNILMICASLPDEVTKKSEPVREPMESSFDSNVIVSKNEPKEEVPIHVMQTRWSMQKRLKKVQLTTLERVYARTKRPTNAMISSIVHVTNLPRKRVVKWFEDKRLEEGVPALREPFHRPSMAMST